MTKRLFTLWVAEYVTLNGNLHGNVLSPYKDKTAVKNSFQSKRHKHVPREIAEIEGRYPRKYPYYNF